MVRINAFLIPWAILFQHGISLTSPFRKNRILEALLPVLTKKRGNVLHPKIVCVEPVLLNLLQCVRTLWSIEHSMFGSADIAVNLLRLFAMAIYTSAMHVMIETVREM